MVVCFELSRKGAHSKKCYSLDILIIIKCLLPFLNIINCFGTAFGTAAGGEVIFPKCVVILNVPIGFDLATFAVCKGLS